MAILATAIRQEEIKGIQTGKEEVKLLLADYILIYIENPKDSTKKLLELANEFSKVMGYKTNIQKSIAFLYPTNELEERETKKTIPFQLHPKNKILRDKFNQRGKRPVLGKLQDTKEKKKSKEIQINESIYYVHRYKELTSLKCP